MYMHRQQKGVSGKPCETEAGKCSNYVSAIPLFTKGIPR